MHSLSRATFSLSVIAIAVLLLAACGDSDGGGDRGACSGLADGLHGDTLCRHSSGRAPVGSFLVSGPFDVQVTGPNIGSNNTTIRVFQLEQVGNGFRTSLVGTTGPKAVVPGIQVRPGDAVNVNFDFGVGEFYIIVQTDDANEWTAIITPIQSLPSG